MKIEVVSTEMIKPSSPTPVHLRTTNLSFLDQIALSIHVPMFLKFKSEVCDAKVSAERNSRLKVALSQTLTYFYPLAGSLKNDGIIDCDDRGVEYTEARIHAPLSDVDTMSSNEVISNFFPCMRDTERMNPVLISIRVSFFECGGMAISLSSNHKFLDAYSCAMFINSWASVSRGVIPTEQPRFDFALYFPSTVDLPWHHLPVTTNAVSKNYSFDNNQIDYLRANLVSNNFMADGEKPLTQFEVVSASIWQQFIESKQKSIDGPVTYVAAFAVGLRGKIGVPTNTFGNLMAPVFTTPYRAPEIRDPEKMKQHLVRLSRYAVNSANDDYFKILKSGQSLIWPIASGDGPVRVLQFRNILRTGFNEADFGWGKPTEANDFPVDTANYVFLMNSTSGNGIEAKVALTAEDMVDFECGLQPLMIE